MFKNFKEREVDLIVIYKLNIVEKLMGDLEKICIVSLGIYIYGFVIFLLEIFLGLFCYVL